MDAIKCWLCHSNCEWMCKMSGGGKNTRES